jgi:hypothetical protein
MPSESPEWRKYWQSDHTLILSNNLFGSAFEEEVDFEATSSSDIAESARAIIVENKDW